MKAKIWNFIRGHKLITAALVAVGLVLIIIAVSSLRGRSIQNGFDQREQAREQQRDELSDQFKQKAAEYAEAKKRIAELESENQKLKTDVADARQAVSAARAERDSLARQHETEKRDLDRIDDFDTLRRVNCERRAKLGYPCEQ